MIKANNLTVDSFRWRMQYKLTELRRAYESWSAEVQMNMRMIREKLQRWSADVSQRLGQWPSVSHLQRRLTDFSHSAKITLMGTYVCVHMS